MLASAVATVDTLVGDDESDIVELKMVGASATPQPSANRKGNIGKQVRRGGSRARRS